ncbi:unnamed protein product [Mycena citricolor]|uniref:beta-glucosidase n=1 Tax=Mycena citricolor TaxID=2018698 RepID=A0AAD2HTK4_9AGAR|nr:unnamed protein product [Mycena citricolor]
MAAPAIRKLPADFLWGFATGDARGDASSTHWDLPALIASFQIEGSTDVDGRGPSIWDEFSRTPGKTSDGRNGDMATDSYNRWEQDVAILAQHGVKTYRFSLAWSRIIPLGGRDDPVNPKGIEFYSKLIDALLAHGIVPFVTLYHWDLPQNLHDRYGGWLNKDEIVKDYVNYARVCFEAFGDRVKHWLTMNEPWCISILGYGRGVFAPGRSSDRTRSPEGDSSTEPWIVGHSVIIAHAYAAKLYREEYKAVQGGQIGITLNGDWQMPYDDSPENVDAAQHALDFAIGWFADPIYLGHYPAYMQQVLGNRLPQFTPAELLVVKGSSDFYGMNTYTTNLCRAGGDDEFQGLVDYTFTRPDGTQLGTQGAPLCMAPRLSPGIPGSSELPMEGECAGISWPLTTISCLFQRYRTPLYVTENGFAVKNESFKTREEAIKDTDRVNYYRGVTASLQSAIHDDGVDVRCYLAWSLLDNFEWADGYVTRFGVVYVDYETQERIPKESAGFVAQWFTERLTPEPPTLKQLATDAMSTASTLSKGSNSLSVAAVPVSLLAQVKAWVSKHIIALLSLLKLNTARR